MNHNKLSLVLLPGLDGTDVFYRPFIAQLPSWINPVVITYPQTRHSSYEELIALVDEKISSVGAFIVMGWSFGGPLALMVADRHPDRVAGVILGSTFVSSPRPHLRPFKPWLATPVVATIRAYRRMRFLLSSKHTALRSAKSITWNTVRSSGLASRARSAVDVDVDVRNLLQQCKADIMYIRCMRDETISKFHQLEICEIAPQTRVADIDGPHLGIFTHAEDIAGSVKRFIDAINYDKRYEERNSYVDQTDFIPC